MTNASLESEESLLGRRFEDQIKVDVCITTFRRPALLAELLASLVAQELVGIVMRIIVIDNDHMRSAREVVKNFRERHDVEIMYDVESQQNIALARNRAICHVRSDYFAFVDDDEVVSPHWLRSLVECAKNYQGDAVFGPVISALPDGAPSWAFHCFRRPSQRLTGERMEYGGAGNVLLRRSAIEDVQIRFNENYGLTGGEDTDFFYRLHLMGKNLIWCNEALATEAVPETRLSLKWIRQRGFRGGQTYNRIFVSRYPGHKKILWFAMKLGQLTLGIAAVPVVRIISYPSYVALTVRIAAASGQLSCCFGGGHFEEYCT